MDEVSHYTDAGQREEQTEGELEGEGEELHGYGYADNGFTCGVHKMEI